jgi:hypothetical protein
MNNPGCQIAWLILVYQSGYRLSIICRLNDESYLLRCTYEPLRANRAGLSFLLASSLEDTTENVARFAQGLVGHVGVPLGSLRLSVP